MSNIEQEKRTVGYMIALYCRKKHGTKSDICEDCQQLTAFAYNRLDNCKFGNDKPACKNCKVHCYPPNMRNKIREVMRYSGPRMVIYYPIDYIFHYILKKPLKQ